MSIEDLECFQEYFRDEEKRDPSRCELKIVETYWSDHCRHTTLNTQIDEVEINGEGVVAADIQESVDRHKARLKKDKKQDSLMGVAQSGLKVLQDDPEFENISNFKVLPEDNACCYETEVKFEDGTTEKWFILFKNETHNSPTEQEPFGGAATCIGGCIRDPMSGRARVLQAMRIS